MGPADAASNARIPAVAGMFYPGDPVQCRDMASGFLKTEQPVQASKRWIGAIVPHAGWICSGAIAGEAIAHLAHQEQKPDVVVIFGAVHTPLPIEAAALDTHTQWNVPGGSSPIAGGVQSKLLESSNLFRVDERFHAREHAVEVELPMIQLAFPDATILPIEVPPNEHAVKIGIETARRIQSAGLKAVYLASSDLTHYGPNYRFTPAGLGQKAIDWAKDNDRRLLGIVTDMTPERVVPETQTRQNACGGGAIAAMMAACRELGASSASILRHTNSCETLAKVAPQPPTNAVGYAGVLVG